jgi:hypothetical protein
MHGATLKIVEYTFGLHKFNTLLRIPWFDPRPIHIRFLLFSVALELGFLPVTQFSTVSTITLTLESVVCHALHIV